MKKQRGFTLIELLVVIAIIAVLAAILFPVFAKSRKAAQNSDCQSNMSQIGRALKIYLSEWHDMYPTNKDLPVVGMPFKAAADLTTLDGSGNTRFDADGKQSRFGVSVNWVEALYPYMEGISGGSSGAWKCGAASDKTHPKASTSTAAAAATASVNYAFNGYLLEQPEGVIRSASSLMMVRELDRKVNANCRPSNVNNTTPVNATNPPTNTFLVSGVDKIYAAGFTTPPENTTNGKQHGVGSNVLFADGHVKGFAVDTYFPAGDGLGQLQSAISYDTNDAQWYNFSSAPTGISVPEIVRRTIAVTP